jgi:hypothetical protein
MQLHDLSLAEEITKLEQTQAQAHQWNPLQNVDQEGHEENMSL